MKKILYSLLAVMFMIPMGFMFSACSKTYTVNYYVEGEIYKSDEYKTGETIPTVEDPQKVGYQFVGWYLNAEESDGQSAFDFSAVLDGSVNLYAHWQKLEYTITYELDGGTNYAENPNNYNIDTPTITLGTPTKTGYVFAGWYAELEHENQVTEIVVGSTGNKTLYANWVPENYTITYELDGGTNNAQNQSGYNITLTLELFAPTKTGYSFDGWFDNADFEGNELTQIAAGSTGNKTLYAKWHINQYTFRFNANGGTEVANIVQDYNSTIVAPTTTREGYDFDGWYLGNVHYEFDKVPANDVDLVARWTAIPYTLTFNANEGENNPANLSTYTIETPTFALYSPTRTGYTFDGWYIDPEFKGEAVSQIELGTTGNKTFYAKWHATQYVITYYGVNGATNNNTGIYFITSPKITFSDASKTGYTFDGWFTEGTFENQITEIVAGSTGDKDIYAKWTAIPYSITYNDTEGATNPNPATYTIDDATITLQDADRLGYDFEGWYANSEKTGEKVTTIAAGSTGPKQFWAKWTIINYDITYNNLQGATNPNPATYTIEDDIEFVAATGRDGYTFAGWYDNQEFTGEAIVGTQHGSTYGNLNLYAKWTANQYTIYFNSNGGSEVANKTQAYDSVVTAPENPTRDGYTFAGWYTEGPSGTLQEFPMNMPLDGATFVAHWTANQYTATILRYDGTEYDSQTYHTGDVVVAPGENELPRDGYTFADWLVTAGDGYWADMIGDNLEAGADTSQETETVYGNLTLKATYTANEYTKTVLDYNGDVVGSETYHAGDPVTTPLGSIVPREYYTFEDWLVVEGSDGYWTEWIGEHIPENISTADSPDFIYGNITLQATYTANEYTITYNLNGGTNAQANPATYTIEDQVTFVAPTKATENGVDYTFIGWYDNAEFNGSAIQGIALGSHENKTLYAKWELQVATAQNLTKALAVANDEPIYITADIVEENPVAITGDATLIGNNNNLYAQISGNGDILLKNIHTTNIKIVANGGFGGNLVFDGGLIQQVNNSGTGDADSAFYSLGNPNASFTFKNMTVAANVTKGIKIGGSAKSVTIDNCTFDSSTLEVIQGGTNSDIQSLSLVDIQIYEGDPTNITIINSYFAYSPQGSTAVPTFVDANGILADSDTGAAIKLKVEKAMHFGTVTITGNTFEGNYRDILVGTAPYANQLQTAAATASNGRSAEGLQYNTIDGWTIENNTTDITAQVAASRGVATLSYIGGPSPFNKYTTRVGHVGQVVDGCGIWVINVAEKVGDTWYYIEDGVYYIVTSSNNTTILAEVSVWDGTASSVPTEDNSAITITSAQEFAAFRDAVNAGNTFEGKTIRLAIDIDLAKIEWTPIGYGDVDHDGTSNPLGPSFKGVFDGQNHTIYNLKITEFAQGGVTNGASAGVALFGQLLGTVQNISVKNAVVSGNHFVGIIAGYALSATIDNCHVSNGVVHCTYASEDNENGDKAGAILGYGAAIGDIIANATTVTNCSATNCQIDAYRDAGQLIGCLHCGSESNNTATNVTVTANHSHNDAKDGQNINNSIVGRVVG